MHSNTFRKVSAVHSFGLQRAAVVQQLTSWGKAAGQTASRYLSEVGGTAASPTGTFRLKGLQSLNWHGSISKGSGVNPRDGGTAVPPHATSVAFGEQA